ncbi:hypothetical protein EGR_06154 [Echinococcus granulosus]|uniref:Uncharacterized protein n=1 Tax=Echinococcus granulosus TaxID=6210 RepID=W6UCF6_ECHGR|nr:hypothetical protein EGR_06154 [Echinococcus granulosus]EUB58935.1 hypothetical protein EGR_06154 [Echinococcus granulosus]
MPSKQCLYSVGLLCGCRSVKTMKSTPVPRLYPHIRYQLVNIGRCEVVPNQVSLQSLVAFMSNTRVDPPPLVDVIPLAILLWVPEELMYLIPGCPNATTNAVFCAPPGGIIRQKGTCIDDIAIAAF